MGVDTNLQSDTSSQSEHLQLGIDVGGSGIKAAVVDLRTGEFASKRRKIATPKKSNPDAVAEVIDTLVKHFDWSGPVGITLPSVVRDQIAYTAANIDKSWIGTDCTKLFAKHLPDHPTYVLNDADAAGLAEVSYGEADARVGTVMFLTFGTGIGSAMLIDGHLYPNTELGHLIIDGKEAEHFASSAIKDREKLTFSAWARRVNKVLDEYERLFNPSLFIVGGGISRDGDRWIPKLETTARVIPAKLRNTAGIVGAAMAVKEHVAP